MAFGKKGGGGGGGHDAAGGLRWLLTYADLITLLLIFFMICFAIASKDQETKKQVAEAIAEAFAPFWSDLPFLTPGEGSGRGIRTPAGAATRKGSPSLVPQIKEATMLLENRATIVRFYEEEIAIDLMIPDLFEADQATLREDAKPFLRRLGELLKIFQNPVEVTAYRTTPAPASFRDLWDLTSRQSVTVVRFLSKECNVDPLSLSAKAMGPTLPAGLSPDRALPAEGGMTLVILHKADEAR